jgi:hypothetical protein
VKAKGLLKIVSEYPEMRGLEDRLIHMQRSITGFNPDRVAIDSISSLERVSTPKAFRELILGVLSYLKVRRIAGLFTYSSSNGHGRARYQRRRYDDLGRDHLAALRGIRRKHATRLNASSRCAARDTRPACTSTLSTGAACIFTRPYPA